MYIQQVRSTVSIVLFSCAMLFSGSALATNDAMLELLQVLRDNGTISEDAYSVLKNSVAADAERTDEKIDKVAEEKLASVKNTADKLKWAERIKLKGDLRLRQQHGEASDPGDDDTRDRLRYRYRLGIEGQVNDTVVIGAGIASGGDDPRSTNETLDDQFETKDARLDYAFAEWKATDWLKVVGGKFKRKAYLWNTTDLLWDSDIRPEGGSVHLEFKNSLGTSYGNAGYWVLDEFSDAADPGLIYAQAGHQWKSEKFFGNAAATLYQFSELEGEAILGEHSSGGNTTDASGDYMFDYDSFGVSGEIGMKNVFLGDKMVAIFGDYIRNSDSDEDTGYAIGFKFGDKKIKMLHDWQFKYVYADLEEDAWLDFLPDSDRFGGATGISAHEFAFKYGLGKHVYLGLDYYDSESELPGSDDDEQILQTDLVFKF